MKYITVIPARGGSKRFPRKNIHDFMGKPLIVHSICQSMSCELISQTFVSTDDLEIKQVSKEYGAEVIDRPTELAGDFASSADVLKHAAEWLIGKGYDFDYVNLLQPTNPLRPKHIMEDAIGIVETRHCDSLVTVSKSDLKLSKIVDGHFIPWNYHFGQRSQDLEPLYYENGLLYISSKDLLLSGRIVSEQAYPMIVTHIFGEVDIDTREDLDYAEYIARKYERDS